MHSELACVLGDALDRLIRAPGADRQGPLIVGLGGSVAVGKSTAAAQCVTYLSQRPERIHGTVVATDGFLFPNAVLERCGAIDRKGEPDTYDEAALLAVMAEIRAGAPSILVPTYSHQTFDVVGQRAHQPGELVIIEGVNALQPGLATAQDVSVYLDAPVEVLEAWFVARFLGLVDRAEVDHTSFYCRFVGLAVNERREMAIFVWRSINLPNLVQFIAPTRDNADLVIELNANHGVKRLVHAGS